MKKKVLISKKKLKMMLAAHFDAGFSSGHKVGARDTSAALAEKATGAFMKAEIDQLMELAKPGDLGAGMGDEEFQTRLRQIAAKYLPQTQE